MTKTLPSSDQIMKVIDIILILHIIPSTILLILQQWTLADIFVFSRGTVRMPFNNQPRDPNDDLVRAQRVPQSFILPYHTTDDHSSHAL